MHIDHSFINNNKLNFLLHCYKHIKKGSSFNRTLFSANLFHDLSCIQKNDILVLTLVKYIWQLVKTGESEPHGNARIRLFDQVSLVQYS